MALTWATVDSKAKPASGLKVFPCRGSLAEVGGVVIQGLDTLVDYTAYGLGLPMAVFQLDAYLTRGAHQVRTQPLQLLNYLPHVTKAFCQLGVLGRHV